MYSLAIEIHGRLRQTHRRLTKKGLRRLLDKKLGGSGNRQEVLDSADTWLQTLPNWHVFNGSAFSSLALWDENIKFTIGCGRPQIHSMQ